jgi:predicted permease
MIGLKMLGDATLPMMLFALGVRLTDLSKRGWQVGVLGAVVCPVTGMAGTYLAQITLRLPAEQFAQLMLFASLPPAALNYLLAERYGKAGRVASPGADRERLRHRVRAAGADAGPAPDLTP